MYRWKVHSHRAMEIRMDILKHIKVIRGLEDENSDFAFIDDSGQDESIMIRSTIEELLEAVEKKDLW